MADRPLRLQEAADRIGVSPASVRRLAAGGHLTRVVLPGLGRTLPRWRIDPDSVERYLAGLRGRPSTGRALLAEAYFAERAAARAAGRKGTGRPPTSGTKKAAATA